MLVAAGVDATPSAEQVPQGSRLLTDPPWSVAGMLLPSGNTVGRAGPEPRPLPQHCAYSQDDVGDEPQTVSMAGEHDASDLVAFEPLFGSALACFFARCGEPDG